MTAYNPLDKKNLGLSVANAMMAMTPAPLDNVPTIFGAGIYALYYHGDFKPYSRLTHLNTGDDGAQFPIYVGKAIPEGGRTGISFDDDMTTTTLQKRLNKHRQSITASVNLDIKDFSLRYLVVERIFIPLGETMLITQTGPLWNTIVQGFGSNDPGAGRAKSERSRWDTLHPGRSYSANLMDRGETSGAIEQDAREYLKSRHSI